MFRLLELCAGYGSQALALKNLGLEVYSEIAEFDKYASQAYMQLHGETKNYGDIYTIDETKLPYFDMITYSTPCFTEDSLVLTEKRGFQKIIDIQIGEKVITHDGNYKTVENVINNGKKKTVKIYGMGIDEIHTTPNHLFYVREKSHVWNNKTRSYTRVFSEPVWKQADSLKRTDYMGIPINKKSEIPEWNGITFVWSDGRKDRYKNQLSQYMNNKDFWWLIGRYIADGWFRNNGGIIIGCGKKKFVEMKEKCDSIGLNYNILEERTVIKFYYQLKELELFVQSFGKYAYGKKIPSFVMDLPVDLLNSFLNGYMSGDDGRFKATSVSRELIYGLAQCIAKVYKQPYSIYKTERPKTTVIEGRTVNQKDTYELCFKKEKRPQDKAFYEDGFIWFPVTKVEEDEIETVYDLTVEENHSFTVQGVIVHNCQDFSVAGKGKGGDKGSGTRSSLLWECERIIRAVKPKYLLMENVKNLLSKKHCHNFNAWIKVLEDMGYTNYYKVLNAKDYGIPQNRERIFVVSICKDIDKKGYVFPNPVPLELRLRDVLEENVPEKYYLSADKVAKLLKSVDVNKYKINEPLALDEQNNYIRKDGRVGTIMTDGSSSKHNNRVIFPLFIKEATKKGYAEAYEYDSITLDQPNSKTRRGRVGKQISNTLTCSCNIGVVEPKVILGYLIRKLTARECFRLMGVKDEQYDRLHDISNSQLYKLAGNSIVVDVLEHIFRNLLMPETTDTKGQLSLF